MLLFVCVFLATGTVGAAACLGVGVGAGTFELFLLLKEHLYPQTGHHQSKNAHSNGKNYEYGLHSMLINADGSRILCLVQKTFRHVLSLVIS